MLAESIRSNHELTESTPFECTQIPRYHWGQVEVDECLREGNPVIISGAPLAEPAVGRWNRDFLTKHMGDRISCTVFESCNNQFRYFDESKNTGGYRKPATQMSKLEMSFKEFSDLVDDPSNQRSILTLTLTLALDDPSNRRSILFLSSLDRSN